MKITSLKLKNIGVFDSLNVDFTGSVVGLIGHNGSGKSTIVESIYTGLTGHFRRFPNALAYVRDQPGQAKCSSGSIVVEFLHNRVKGRVTRSLSVSKRATDSVARQQAELKLHFPGVSEPETVSGTNAVNARLADLIGIPSDVVGRYAFIEQGQICQLISGDASTRAKSIHSLFGLDRFEDIWKLLGTEVTRIPVLTVVDTVETLSASKAETLRRRSEVSDQVAEAERVISLHDTESAQRELDVYAKFVDVNANLQKLNSAVAVETAALSNIRHNLAVATEKKRETAAAYERAKPAAQEAELFFEDVKRVTATKDALTRLSVRSSTISRRVQELGAVPVKPDVVFTAEQQAELDRLSGEINTSSTFLRSVDKLKSSTVSANPTCPTCGQSVKDIAAAITQHTDKLQKFTIAYSDLCLRRNAVNSAWDAHKAATAKYEAEAKSILADSAAIKKEEADLKAVLASLSGDYSEAACARQRSFVNELNTLVGSLRTIDSSIVELSAAVLRAEQSLSSANANLALANSSLSAFGNTSRFTDDYILTLRGRVKSASDAVIAKARLDENLRNIDLQLRDLDARIVRAQDLAKRAAQHDAVRALLNSARDVFHRDNIQRDLAVARITAVDQQLRNFLYLMQSNYTAAVESTPDGYLFNCTFSDGTVREALSLSGGEKVRFSLSFIMAVNAVLAHNLGIVVLDEPTDQLDADNQQHLLTVLEYVRNYAKSTGLQLFIVTHVPQLQSVFDQVITLHEGSIVEQ